MMLTTEAYAEMLAGQRAAREGEPLSSSPHRPGTRLHRAWERGWAEVTESRRKIAGTYGISDDERAALRASHAVVDPVAEILGIDPEPMTPVRHPGDVSHLTRPDPVELILNPPVSTVADLGPIVGGGLDLTPAQREALTKMATDLAETFRASMEDLVEALRPMITAVHDWVEALVPTTPGPKLERRRHGHAAVCPRHGPTRGGTCLVCVRGRR